VSAFSSLLVANRGEIARRIFGTARAMGLQCIAVFVDDDAGAPFVTDADHAVRLPPGGYLDPVAIIDAARRTGAQAIHPGYGFLAENAAFAAAVIDAGIVWVGPSPTVIRTMGDKLAAKRAATDAGVPTLPSSEDPTGGDLPSPVLVKAAAGGGGKGMRIVTDESDLTEAVAAARREAASAFGDDRVFAERYVPASHHVEIQILGDADGGLVHLGERECSIQRRHQKIIEESPSSVVDPALREAMGTAALRLARAIGYQSAGTVEFLVDDGTHEFFFLEVNTRLQVEHPVTEAVTGIDLVREQLRIAAGETLGYGQADVRFSGHAIEARLYAEDPANGFLPATGMLAAFAPAAVPAVRWDAGVDAGSVVGVQFDPMLAKVIAHAPTRAEAAGRLAMALERLHLGGVRTNRDFLAATLRTPDFLDGNTTTDFIERVEPAADLVLDEEEARRIGVAAALWLAGEPVSGDGARRGSGRMAQRPAAAAARHTGDGSTHARGGVRRSARRVVRRR
jgi:propionyl-CoA carboxylase alpha chain